jgi:tetratricopeptide (TPR) repeat protein
MEPVTALSVAGVAVQFAVLAAKITTRLLQFISDAEDGPFSVQKYRDQLNHIKGQINLLGITVEKVAEAIRRDPSGYSSEEVFELSEFLGDLMRKCGLLNARLEDYLPDPKWTKTQRAWRALESICYDDEITRIHQMITCSLPYLTTLLVAHMTVSGFVKPSDSPQTRHRPIYQVSRHRVWNFIHRMHIERSLHDQLLNHGRFPSIVVLQGMGGQGKSQLALQYCEQARIDERYSGIFWVDASGSASVIRCLEHISDELRTGEESFVGADARIAHVKRVLGSWVDSWLIVFDNYDNPDEFDLRDYIPMSTKGHVIVTSRSYDTYRLGTIISVGSMDEDEAVALLLEYCNGGNMEKPNRTESYAKMIVKRLGYLPLAIDQAGAYVQAEEIPLEGFLDEYERSAAKVLATTPKIWEYWETKHGGSIDQRVAAKSVITTWELSLSWLRPNTQQGSLKAKLLHILALFHETSISEELFFEYHGSLSSPNEYPDWMSLFLDDQGAWSQVCYSSVMREFRNLSLINSLQKSSSGGDFYIVSLHPLVRDWIKLREGGLPVIEGVSLAALMLAAVVRRGYWERFCLIQYAFPIPIESRRHYLGHVTSWHGEFRKYRLGLKPTPIPIDPKVPWMKTAEQMLGKFLIHWSMMGQAAEVFQWLWDVSDISDETSIPIKFDAGLFLTNCHFLSMREVEAVRVAESALKFWQTQKSFDYNGIKMVRLSSWLLIFALNRDGQSTRAEELVEEELSQLVDQELMSWRHQALLTEKLYSLNSKGPDASERAVDLAKAMVRMTGGGPLGATQRPDLWVCRTWSILLDTLEKYPEADALSAELLEVTCGLHGTSHFLQLLARIYRGRALLNIGKLTESEAILLQCAREVAGSTPRDGVQVMIYDTLGDILFAQDRLKESFDAYKSALVHAKASNRTKDLKRILRSAGLSCLTEDANTTETLFETRYILLEAEDPRNTVEIIVALWDSAAIKVQIGGTGRAQDALQLSNRALQHYGASSCETAKSEERYETEKPPADLEVSLDAMGSELIQTDVPIVFQTDADIGGIFSFDFQLLQALNFLALGDHQTARTLFAQARSAFTISQNASKESTQRFLTWSALFTYRNAMLYKSKETRSYQCWLDFENWARYQIKRVKEPPELLLWFSDCILRRYGGEFDHKKLSSQDVKSAAKTPDSPGPRSRSLSLRNVRSHLSQIKK